jgi:hypothetical protein
MTHQPQPDSPASTSRIGNDTPQRARRRHVGAWIAIIGIIFLVPMMVCAVFIAEGRGLFALLALTSWIVWKIGRTIIKFNSPGELR